VRAKCSIDRYEVKPPKRKNALNHRALSNTRMNKDSAQAKVESLSSIHRNFPPVKSQMSVVVSPIDLQNPFLVRARVSIEGMSNSAKP